MNRGALALVPCESVTVAWNVKSPIWFVAPAQPLSIIPSTLGVTGGIPPYSWDVSSGLLPLGLSLAADTGVISGTPIQSGDLYFQRP
jgi:hypothetical protein